jgi:aminoglycoside phosphotransferase (APT) family kinase protein
VISARGADGTGLPGLDLDRLEDWFAVGLPGAGRLRSARLIAGGKSNLTYEISDGQRSWVLRRPPLGHVLATAHDMTREYRIMSALADTEVPVPVMYALCEDDAVVGAPFFVMEKVDGIPFRHAFELSPLGPRRVREISTRLVDSLVALHQVDPEAIGLGDFGRPDGFLARQVNRWAAQLRASWSRPLPAADELYRMLADDIPAQSPPGVVHGDYRLDNVLIDHDDKPAAVIDWEMATLGDPTTDLALLIAYKRVGEMPEGGAVSDASSAPGFLAEQEIVERYAQRSGRDLRRFGFYLGLACYKLAAVLEGIHYRHLQGQTVGAGFDRIGALTEPLLEAGLASVKEYH